MNLQASSPTVTPTPSNNSLTPPCLKNNEINIMNNNNNTSLTEVNKVSKIKLTFTQNVRIVVLTVP